MKKNIPTLKTDREAERFVDTADLSNMIFPLEGFEKELALRQASLRIQGLWTVGS